MATKTCVSKLFLLFCTACAVILSGSCSPHSDLKPKLPFGSLDIPRAGDTVHGVAGVGGWALSEAGIKEVCVYVDRGFVACTQTGANRPDVAKAFPALNNETSGWNISVKTAPYKTGPHELTVQATDNNGATRDLGTVIINIVTP
jgi:hypothetical protein